MNSTLDRVFDDQWICFEVDLKATVLLPVLQIKTTKSINFLGVILKTNTT